MTKADMSGSGTPVYGGMCADLRPLVKRSQFIGLIKMAERIADEAGTACTLARSGGR